MSDVPLHSASLIPKGRLQDGSRAQTHPGRLLEKGSSPRAALPAPQLAQAFPGRTFTEQFTKSPGSSHHSPFATKPSCRFSPHCPDQQSLTHSALPASVSNLHHCWLQLRAGQTRLAADVKQKMLLCVNAGFSAADGNSLWFKFRCPGSRDIVATALKCRKVGNSTLHKVTAPPDLRKGTRQCHIEGEAVTSGECLNSQKIRLRSRACPLLAVWPWTSHRSSPRYPYLYPDTDQCEHSGALQSSKLANLCSGRPLPCLASFTPGAFSRFPRYFSQFIFFSLEREIAKIQPKCALFQDNLAFEKITSLTTVVPLGISTERPWAVRHATPTPGLTA